MSDTAVSRLTLSHFRSHRRTRVETDGRTVALFGPNGAGKTNVLEALSLLSPGRGLRRVTADELIRRPEALGWKITAEITSAGRLHEIETTAQPGQSRGQTIDGKSSPQTALARLLRILWLVPAMDRLWIESAEGRRRFLDRMTLSFEPSHAEASLTYEKAMRDRNRLLKDQVRDDRWYGALESRMAEAGARIDRARRAAIDRLVSAQAGAKTVFPTADLSLGSDPALSDASALAVMLHDSRPDDLRAGRTLVGPHRADLTATYVTKEMPAAQCSTGEQKALLISLILANARALHAETQMAPILLLDEVAAHLDADRRRALYDEIAALGAQAWMTGTGAELFEDLGEGALKLHVRDEDGESVVGPT